MDSHLLCDGAIGVTLFRQRTYLIMLGLACLSPQSIGIGEAAIMPISGKFIRYLDWRIKRQPYLDGAAMDTELARDSPVRQSLARERVNLGNACLTGGLP
jgi:hypothetical protein